MDTHVAFDQQQCIASGSLQEVALVIYALGSYEKQAAVLVFELETGRQMDLDLRGSEEDVCSRYGEDSLRESGATPEVKRGRGRPKLGVVGREVTLLPRHWEWLDAQRGGASGMIRRLVDEARKESSQADRIRKAQDRTNRFLSAMAGDLPRYEDATRALYAKNHEDFKGCIKPWPEDIRKTVNGLSVDAF